MDHPRFARRPHDGSDNRSALPSTRDDGSSGRKEEIYPSKKKKEKKVVHLSDVITDGKKKMQSATKHNGVTFAIIGSSGCGKSTLIRKVLLDDIYKSKEYLVTVFTESAKCDAFDDMDKNIIIDKKGLDMDAIYFCYHMNSRYDKKYNFVVLLDDVIHIRYNKLIQSMFLTMRNTNITSIVSLQYPKLIPVCVRTSVYFSLLFHFNNAEAVEMVVRGWMSAYLPGKNVREKMDSYVEWTSGGDGHRCFLVDNLNHTAYRVDENYQCYQLEMLSFANGGVDKNNEGADNEKTSRKRKRNEDTKEEKIGDWSFMSKAEKKELVRLGAIKDDGVW